MLLRPVLASDYELIRVAESIGTLGQLWRHRGAVPSPETFAQRLWQNVLTQYLVVPRAEPRRVLGLVLAYNASFLDNHAYVAFAKFDGPPQGPLFLQGCALFVDYVFDTWPFRKLYGEANERTYAQFGSEAGRLFDEEARLRDYVYISGEHVDQIIVAVSRDRWNEHGRRYALWARLGGTALTGIAGS